MIKAVLFIFAVFIGQSLFVNQHSQAQGIVGYTFNSEQKQTPFPLELRPFATDGCTKSPDGTKENPTLWLHCCLAHDVAYWLGGTEQERKIADQNLYQCVKDTGEPKRARLMYLGTRAGGIPLGQKTYRWGFGWNRVRDYKVLSVAEKQMAYDMYGENLETLNKGINENAFPVVVPKSNEYESPFLYSFCEEEIINYLSPLLTKTATVTKFNDFGMGSDYKISIGLDICSENIEFQFTPSTNYGTCKKDYAYQKIINKFEDVKISSKCLKKIREN